MSTQRLGYLKCEARYPDLVYPSPNPDSPGGIAVAEYGCGMRQRLLVGVVLLMTVCGWYAAYRTVRLTVTIASELDRANHLTNIAARARSTIVMDRRGRPAFAFYSEQRIDVPIDQVSPHMV
jgi:membrane peptidoglycan carboxypeptidase